MAGDVTEITGLVGKEFAAARLIAAKEENAKMNATGNAGLFMPFFSPLQASTLPSVKEQKMIFVKKP